MRFHLPAVGVVFDLNILKHGFKAIELFMKHTNPLRLGVCFIASGDVLRSESEVKNSRYDYCVAVSGEAVTISYVQQVFRTLDDPGLAPIHRRFIYQPLLDSIGLSMDGQMDGEGRFVTDKWNRSDQDRCMRTGWGYAPRAVNDELSPEEHAVLDNLSLSRRRPQFQQQMNENELHVSIPLRASASPDSQKEIKDYCTPNHHQAQSDASGQGAKVGDMHVGFRVISVKDGALDHQSIVLAENVNATLAAKYVVWTLDRHPGGGYKAGTYVSDKAEAQRIFNSRKW